MNLLKVKNALYKVFLEVFIFDKKKRTKMKSRFCKKHIKKYVDIAIKRLNDTSDEKNDSKIIWQYWHQGKNSAPTLIQKCFESIEKFQSGYEQKILDYKSIEDYVEIPSKYYDLLNRNKISITHFSDILRIYLLGQYGGSWVDSTIYLTNKIPDDIMNADFFVFQKNRKEDPLENSCSIYFFRASRHSKTIAALKDVYFQYFCENDSLINYFFVEHLLTMLSEKEELKKDWANIPFYDVHTRGNLQRIIFQKFDEKQFEQIKKETPIHKLTYKIIDNKDHEGSFYDYILKQS